MVKKIIVVLIALTLVLQMATPFGILKGSAEDHFPEHHQQKDTKDFPKRGKERKELSLHKTETSSTYLNPDGSFTKEIYGEPVQFKGTDGKWKSIKNELKESKKDGFTIENEENSLKTYFNDSAKFQLKEKDYEITFSLLGTQNNKPTINKNLLGYKNIFEQTDLNYKISSSTVKEELILNTKKSPTIFTYQLETKNLKPVLNEDYSISFIDKKEEKYQMNPFFAYDSNEQNAPKMIPMLEEENGKYKITISLDENWFNAEERKFPVIIDPTITSSRYADDAMIYSADPTINYSAWEHIRAGYNGYGKGRSYIKFNMESLPTGAVIDTANLSLHQTETTSATTEVDVHEVTTDWNYSSVTWNNQPTFNPTPIATQTFPVVGREPFAITDVVKKWYNGEEINYGFLLKAKDELQTKREFSSSRTSVSDQLPKIEITYHIDGLGIEDYWSYDNGVNLHNGNLALSSVDASVSGKGHPIVVSRTYNSRSKAKGVLGNGWQLNTEMKMKFEGEPTIGKNMLFVDADGTETTLTHFFEDEWETSNSFEEMVYYHPNFTTYTGITMYDKNHNTYIFDKVTGLLKETEDQNGLKTTYAYNADQTLKTITDSSNRTVNFEYLNGKLTKIFGNEITTVQFTYTSDNLTKVEAISSTGNVLSAVTYGYDVNNNLTTVTDLKNHTSEIQYTTDDRVSSFVEKVTDNGLLTTLTTNYEYNFIDYDTVMTTKTDPKGIITRFHTNDVGNIVKVEENFNTTTGTSDRTNEFVWDENNLLTEVVDPRLKKTMFGYNNNRDVEEITDPKLSKELYKYDGFDLTQYTSSNGETSQNHYDAKKNNTSYIDTSGNADASTLDAYGNVTKSSNSMSLGENLINNGSFEKWTNGLPNTWSLYGTASISNILNSTGKVNGKSSVRLRSTSDTVKTEIISDYIPVYGDSSYNVSWYKFQMGTGKSEIKIRWYSSTTSFISEEIVGTVSGDIQEWLRRSGNVTAPTNAIYGRIVLSATNVTSYFDNLQMEQGQFINKGNIVSNDSFEIDQDQNGIPDRWSTTSNVSLDSANSYSGEKSVKIVGDGINKHYATHQFEFSGKKGTVIEFSGYSKAEGLTGATGDYILRLRVENQDGTTSFFTSNYTKSTHDWEYKTQTVVLPKDFKRFNVYGQFGNQTGTAWYDDIKLTVISADNAQISNYNLAENGSFEQTDGLNNPYYWTKVISSGGTITTEKTNEEGIYVGNNSIRFKDTVGWAVFVSDSLEPLKDNESYTFSVMAKAKNLTSGKGFIKFQIHDVNGVHLADKNGTVINTNEEWKRLFVTLTEDEAKLINPNAHSIKVAIVSDSNTMGEIYYDALRFEENNQFTSVTYDTKGNYMTSSTNEDGDVIRYTNDNRGRTTRTEFIKTGSFVETAFDELDHVTTTKDSRGLTVEPIYDAVGNVTELKYKKTSNGSLLGSLKNEYNELNEVTKTHDQNNFTTNFERDKNRNITKTILPNNKSILYGYNALNELTNISFQGDTNTFSFEYDVNGNLTKETKNGTEITSYSIDSDINQINKITNPSGSTIDINYDQGGNVTSYKHSIFNQPTLFQYSGSGSVDRTITPFGTEIKRNYDETGRIVTEIIKNGTVSSIHHYEYNQIGQLTKKWVETGTGTKLAEDEIFSYDKNGNITEISYSNGTKDTFIYDVADHLTNEKRTLVNGVTDYEKSYMYDEIGNRLTQTNGVTTKNYQYDAANQLLSDGTTNFVYDEVGNLLSDKDYNYTYTATDQIKEVKDKLGNVVATYEYNSDGLRTKKTTSSGIEKYVYFDGHLEYITDGNDALKYSFIIDNGKYIGFIDHTTTTPTVYHYVTNYRGDVVAIKDINGSVVVTYSYDSFGNILASTGTTLLGNNKLLKEENPIRYASYVYDNETKLYYVKARYYNSELGRFTTRDPVPNDNLYTYTENNPVNLVDPSGETALSSGYANIRPSEKKIMKKNKINLISYMSLGAYASYRANSLFTIKKKNGTKNKSLLEDGPGDAFRHAYWSALMTKLYGYELAKKLATAHEDDPNSWYKREMDLYNNSVGRKIALANPNASAKELENLVLKALEQGKLKTVDKTCGLKKACGSKDCYVVKFTKYKLK